VRLLLLHLHGDTQPSFHTFAPPDSVPATDGAASAAGWRRRGRLAAGLITREDWQRDAHGACSKEAGLTTESEAGGW